MTDAQREVQKSMDQALKKFQARLMPFEDARTSSKTFRNLVQEADEPRRKFACRIRRMANKPFGQLSEEDRDKGMYFQYVAGLQTESVLVEILKGSEEDFMTTIERAERSECAFGDFESKATSENSCGTAKRLSGLIRNDYHNRRRFEMIYRKTFESIVRVRNCDMKRESENCQMS